MSCDTVVTYVGMAKTWTLTIESSPGVRQNLTGAEIQIRLKQFDGDPDPPLALLEIGAGIILLDQTPDGPTEGQATVTWPATDTPGVGSYRYAGILILPDADPIPCIEPSDWYIKAIP